MKKSLLLLACATVLAACTASNGDKNTPPPSPAGGEMSLNYASKTMKYDDTIHLQVINAPVGAKITYSIDDDYSIYHVGNGVILAMAIGQQDVVVKVNGKTFTCPITVEKTYDECIFKEPFFEFGTDTVAVNAGSKALGYTFSEMSVKNDVASIEYANSNVTTDYQHLYLYEVNLVKTNDVVGLVSSMCFVPTKVKDETNEFFASFAERHYQVGNTSDNLIIFQDRDHTYSILVGLYTLDTEKTVFALGCEYINVQEWNPVSAPMQFKRSPVTNLEVIEAPQNIKTAFAKQGLKKANVR